jgi:hypothetical protein
MGAQPNPPSASQICVLCAVQVAGRGRRALPAGIGAIRGIALPVRVLW